MGYIITGHSSQHITLAPIHNATVTTALLLLAIFSILFLVPNRQARSKNVHIISRISICNFGQAFICNSPDQTACYHMLGI
jgi:hypothetical protein